MDPKKNVTVRPSALGDCSSPLSWQGSEELNEHDKTELRDFRVLRQWLESLQLILFGPCIILQYICNPARYTMFYD